MISEKLWKKFKKTRDWIRIFVSIIGLVLIILWALPDTRNYLTTVGVFDEKTLLAIVGTGLLMMLFVMIELQINFDYLNRKIEAVILQDGSSFIQGGPVEVIEKLGPLLNALNVRSERKIYVMGMTLDTAWSNVRNWVEKPDFESMEIILFCIHPNFARENVNMLDKETLDLSERIKDEAEKYIEMHKDVLAKKQITIELVAYEILPPLHGVMLGNGALFTAFSDWGMANSLLPKQFCYEYFSRSDNTARAESYRNLFKNLMEEAGRPFNSTL